MLRNRANHVLVEMKKCHNNFFSALELLDCPQKSRKGRSGKGKSSHNLFTDIWVNSMVTDEFVMAKISGYPEWPARLCVAKDSKIETILKNAGLCVVSFIGEPHLHVIKREEDIHPFTTEVIETVDLATYPSDTVKKFKQVRHCKRFMLANISLGITHLLIDFFQCVTIAKLLVRRDEAKAEVISS